MQTLSNYIGGRLVAPVDGHYLDDYEPATGQVYARLPESSLKDLDGAVEAAKTAFPAWSKTPAIERSRIMLAIADHIERRLPELARAETIDNGKPIALSRSVDIPRAATNFRFYAGAATQFFSEFHSMEVGAINYTLRQPVGVVACISPWNLPLYLFSWKIAPALAAGNCVIGKPSEITPMTAFLLSEICADAELPPGVLNILHGSGPVIGQSIIEHPAIGAISFTGGTATGKTIAQTAAPEFKKLSLELGGKNPNIIFADCDWNEMLDATVRAAFSNQGEICLCGSRIYVEQSVYERFKEEFVKRVRALHQGDPLDERTEQGALVSATHLNKVVSYIELARKEGGTMLCGGERFRPESDRCADGWFVQPTVIDGLPADCRTNQEEIFGPVVTITPFESEEEAIAMANGTQYGLAASVFSQDISRCLRLAEYIESGIIWVNTWMLRDLRTPMGGMKQSGIGREGGFEALRFFTEPKNICVKYR